MTGLTLPPGAVSLVDSLVGSFLGGSRSEVLRFIVVSWITEHRGSIRDIANDVIRRKDLEAR